MLLTPLKSYAVSIALHAALFAALFAIPSPSRQRFSSTGESSVISIEARVARASSFGAASFSPRAVPLSQSEPIAREDLEPVAEARLLEPPHRAESRDRDRLVLKRPPDVAEKIPPVEMVRRRTRQTPPPVLAVSVPRPRVTGDESSLVAVTPPEQFAGFEATAVDLSRNPPPEYPPEAIRHKWEGMVLLQLRVDKTGQVVQVEVVKSSGHVILDRAAQAAVATWRGRPAMRWGNPVECVERLPIRFRL